MGNMTLLLVIGLDESAPLFFASDLLTEYEQVLDSSSYGADEQYCDKYKYYSVRFLGTFLCMSTDKFFTDQKEGE